MHSRLFPKHAAWRPSSPRPSAWDPTSRRLPLILSSRQLISNAIDSWRNREIGYKFHTQVTCPTPTLRYGYSPTSHSPATCGVDVKFVKMAVAVRRFTPR